MQTPQFGGFQPSGKAKIAQSMGFQGPMEQFDKFLEDNPDRQAEMMRYEDFARKMVSGGYVSKMQEGGDVGTDPPEEEAPQTIGDIALERMDTPALPVGGAVTPVGTVLDPTQDIGTSELGKTILDPTVEDVSVTAAGTGETALADTPISTAANTVTTKEVTQDVNTALNAVGAAQVDPDDPRNKIVAAETTESSVKDLTAAKGSAHLLENPVQRELQEGELIDPVANAEKARAYTEEIQAATATPSEKATTAFQLKTLTEGFDLKNPPPYAAAAIEAVQAEMASRGLSASSVAGQALIDAALRSAIPIASSDAQTFAKFEERNLSNRQERAMLAAEQRAAFIGQEFDQQFQARVLNSARIGDIADKNFTAEQNIAMENSRAVNTMNLNNLSNEQALVLAEAAALTGLDTTNLNNRQQAAVQNAASFLGIDMQNVSNQQQMDLFKAQQRIGSLFTDQAALNASSQFNASSQNQVDQFFNSLANSASQFNAAQKNGQNQQNAGREDAMERFQEDINNQRDQFNAQNRLIIDQSNVNWRRQIGTADTVAVNRANELNASALLNMSDSAYNNLWQYFGDSMEWAWTSAENERSRVVNLAIEQLRADSNADLAEAKLDYASSASFGKLIGTILTANSGSFLGNLLGVG